MDRRELLKGAAIAIPAAAIAASVPGNAQAATLTNQGEISQLFDNCSDVQNPTLSNNNETLVMASAYMSLQPPSAADKDDAVVIQGAVYVIPGEDCEGIYVRFRRGYGTTGAIDYELGNGGYYVVPGKFQGIPINGIMNTTAYRPGPGQYSVTLETVGSKTPTKVIYGSVAFTYVEFNH